MRVFTTPQAHVLIALLFSTQKEEISLNAEALKQTCGELFGDTTFSPSVLAETAKSLTERGLIASESQSTYSLYSHEKTSLLSELLEVCRSSKKNLTKECEILEALKE